MHSSAPLVSVIIPCYNQAHFLPEAIESALSQRNQTIEVVVVDDSSRDNIAGVVGRYSDILVVRRENRGLAGRVIVVFAPARVNSSFFSMLMTD